jgi:hypothetical protein
MAARLKVFVTSDGFTDYVVAASSRPKALAAWGVRQDLFKEGQAHETDDPKLADEARARPGEVLRRPAGSREALARAKPAKKLKAKTPSKAALKRVAALEAKLKALDEQAAGLEDELARQVAALEAKAAVRRETLAEQKKALSEDLRKARRAAET